MCALAVTSRIIEHIIYFPQQFRKFAFSLYPRPMENLLNFSTRSFMPDDAFCTNKHLGKKGRTRMSTSSLGTGFYLCVAKSVNQPNYGFANTFAIIDQ